MHQKKPLPPSPRSRIALGLTSAAARGVFELQQCQECSKFQYPPAEMCRHCLGEQLIWCRADGAGKLLSETALHHSQNQFYADRTPWRIGLIQLNIGPTVVAHLAHDAELSPCPVIVDLRLDRSGRGVLVATSQQDTLPMPGNKQHSEMGCDPESRSILVTDGQSDVGQAIVRALAQSGAKNIWVGGGNSASKDTNFMALEKLPGVEIIGLDLTNPNNMQEQAKMLGDRVDIVINTVQACSVANTSSLTETQQASTEIELNYLGLLHLAQEFGPKIKHRSGQGHSVAWVNLLSIFALTNHPSQGTYSASQAAAFSLSQYLRSDFQAYAVKVLNVFFGPIDDIANELIPPPKLAPDRLAKDLVAGLARGVEDVYSGEFAQEIYSRYREDPKILEKELSHE
ncbi:MAG: SDR family NAD(P)-dependent oxidoreductase [Gammaproteobacteria bacterium]|nr:SDR family NAD(P)-dependent oxidoreductase [Gammaproteobacteria bacterium]